MLLSTAAIISQGFIVAQSNSLFKWGKNLFTESTPRRPREAYRRDKPDGIGKYIDEMNTESLRKDKRMFFYFIFNILHIMEVVVVNITRAVCYLLSRKWPRFSIAVWDTWIIRSSDN